MSANAAATSRHPRVLVIVASDPRESARPAEAIRIAAGVGAWRRAEMNLYLRGPAVRSLTEFADELVDEDNFTRYLPMLAEWERPILVQQNAKPLGDLGEAVLKYREIDDAELAVVAGEHDIILRF
ncbi:MAG: hypothetical protein H7A46_06005 [Verrucomicrobiales bacterium]|nr:hypothetical protein [Verrucomicrobiales bacterium]